MKKGIIPRGWFVAYARAHEQLFKACIMSVVKGVKPDTLSYNRIQRNYSRVVNAFAAEHSTVVERRIVPSFAKESSVVESDPPEVDRFAKFSNKTKRTADRHCSSACSGLQS